MKIKLNLFLMTLMGFIIGIILSIPFSYPYNMIIPLTLCLLFGYSTLFYYYRKE